MMNNYNNQEEYDTPLRDNIGALWKKRGKDGKEYFVGRVESNGLSQEIIIFINTDKRSGRQPDYVIREQINKNNQIRQRDDQQRSSQHNW